MTATLHTIVCVTCDRPLAREELRDELCAMCKAHAAGIDELFQHLRDVPPDLQAVRGP